MSQHVSTCDLKKVSPSGQSEVATLTVANGFTLSAGNFDASASTGTFQTGSGAISLNGPTPKENLHINLICIYICTYICIYLYSVFIYIYLHGGMYTKCSWDHFCALPECTGSMRWSYSCFWFHFVQWQLWRFWKQRDVCNGHWHGNVEGCSHHGTRQRPLDAFSLILGFDNMWHMTCNNLWQHVLFKAISRSKVGWQMWQSFGAGVTITNGNFDASASTGDLTVVAMWSNFVISFLSLEQW